MFPDLRRGRSDRRDDARWRSIHQCARNRRSALGLRARVAIYEISDEHGAASMPVPLILALAASTALAMPPTSKPFDQLRAVNATINSTVRYETDHDLYGRDELWTVARDAGDCEDIALRKREELLKLGWAPQDLRLMRVDIYDKTG